MNVSTIQDAPKRVALAPPNYTQIPNALIASMADMGDAELRVALAVARKTLGWHKTRDKLSLTQLQELTGLTRQGVINGVQAGEARGMILRSPDGQGFFYELLVNDVDQSDVLEHRTSQRGRPELVNDVDQQLVNVVDTQKKDKNKKKKGVVDGGLETSAVTPTTPKKEAKSDPTPLEAKPSKTYVYAEESGIFGNKPHGKQTANDEYFFSSLMGDGFIRKISDAAKLRRWRSEHGDDYIRLAAKVAKDPDFLPQGKKPMWLFEDYLDQSTTLPTPLMQLKRQDKAKDLERLRFERERPDLQDGDRVQWNRDLQFYTLYGGIVAGGFTLEERPDVGIVPAEQLLLVERPDYDWSEGAYLPTHTEIKQQQYAENALRDAA